MATLILLLAMLATAAEFVWTPPTYTNPSPDDCPAFVELVPGSPVPPSLLSDGLIRCRATVAPPSDLAYLLRVQTWAERAAPRGQELVLQLDWERERVERYKLELSKPVAWHQRAHVQRWAGRIEALATVALAVVVLDASTEVTR